MVVSIHGIHQCMLHSIVALRHGSSLQHIDHRRIGHDQRLLQHNLKYRINFEICFRDIYSSLRVLPELNCVTITQSVTWIRGERFAKQIQ